VGDLDHLEEGCVHRVVDAVPPVGHPVNDAPDGTGVPVVQNSERAEIASGDGDQERCV